MAWHARNTNTQQPTTNAQQPNLVGWKFLVGYWIFRPLKNLMETAKSRGPTELRTPSYRALRPEYRLQADVPRGLQPEYAPLKAGRRGTRPEGRARLPAEAGTPARMARVRIQFANWAPKCELPDKELAKARQGK
jgi:hypothetical protein